EAVASAAHARAETGGSSARENRASVHGHGARAAQRHRRRAREGYGSHLADISSPSGGELTEQLPVDPRHDLGKVLRNQPRTGRTPRLAMQPDRGRGRLESRHALGEATRRDARKDVARPGGGEPRRRIVGNRGAPGRSGNYGGRPLEENYRAARLRRPTGSLKLRGSFICQRIE